MKYILPLLMITSAYFGVKVAQEKGYNTYVWAILCGLLPFLIVVLLLFPYKKTMSGTGGNIQCRFCAEDIKEDAIVCKHCGRDLAIKI